MADNDVEAPEVELLSNGKIRIRIDGRPYSLRRPTIGEFRSMREALYELRDAITAMPKDAEIEVKALTEKLEATDDPDERADLERRVLEVDRIGEKLDGLYLSQMRAICEPVINPALPKSDDDLPLWMASLKVSNEFLSHWRDTPLAFGGQ